MEKNKKLILDNNLLEELVAEAYAALLIAEKIIKLQNDNRCLTEVEDSINNINKYWDKKWS